MGCTMSELRALQERNYATQLWEAEKGITELKKKLASTEV